MTYEITETIYGTVVIIRQNNDGTVTSFLDHEGNADYQQYLIDTDGGLPLPKENA